MLPRSSAAVQNVRKEPCRKLSTSLAFGASPANEGILPSGDFVSEDDLGVNDAQLELISGDKHQSMDIIFDELFAFEDDTLGQRQCSTDVSLSLHQNLDQEAGSWCTWMRGDVSLAVLTESSMVKSYSNILAVCPLDRPHAQHNADLILQSLRSFPTMMIRRETFPWFIHSHSQLLSKSTGAALPEALTNCMSIAQLFVSRTSETKYFFRQIIGAEQRRFNSEVRSLLSSCSFNTNLQLDVPNVQLRTPHCNASLHDLLDHVHC